jgi:hypothetical protein
MTKYKATKPFGGNETECPPAWISIVFPDFNGEPASVFGATCIIEFATETTVMPNPNVVIEKWSETTEAWEPFQP